MRQTIMPHQLRGSVQVVVRRRTFSRATIVVCRPLYEGGMGICILYLFNYLNGQRTTNKRNEQKDSHNQQKAQFFPVKRNAPKTSEGFLRASILPEITKSFPFRSSLLIRSFCEEKLSLADQSQKKGTY